jgi:hypothetical protein
VNFACRSRQQQSSLKQDEWLDCMSFLGILVALCCLSSKAPHGQARMIVGTIFKIVRNIGRTRISADLLPKSKVCQMGPWYHWPTVLLVIYCVIVVYTKRKIMIFDS